MNERFESINLQRMHNEEIFSFYTEFRTNVRNIGAGELHLLSVWDLFMSLYDKYDAVLEQIRKSDYTSQLADLDRKRDILFNELKKNIKSFSKHFEVAKATAARKLMIVLKVYQDAARKSYEEETGLIYNFVKELRDNYTAETATLNIAPWITELDKANKEFKELKGDRSLENETKDLGYNAKIIRNQLDETYLDAIDYVFAGSLLDTTETCKKFLRVWNEVIEEYKNKMAVREGKNAADKGEKN